jgi:hypothetical protein
MAHEIVKAILEAALFLGAVFAAPAVLRAGCRACARAARGIVRKARARRAPVRPQGFLAEYEALRAGISGRGERRAA